MSICSYRYDAGNRLICIQTPVQTGWRYWHGSHVANEVRIATDQTRQLTWLQAAGQPLAQLQPGAPAQRLLLAGDSAGSTLLEGDAGVRTLSYSPQGFRGEGQGAQAEPGFNSERLDAVSGCYLLGPGHHRPYSPTLALFLAPDRASPFGRGGLNSLSYCASDPVNRSDPSGHFWKWIVASVTLVASVVAVALTAGTAAGVMIGAVALTKASAGAVAATTLGVASIGTEVAALTAHETGAENAGNILGWVGLGLGLAGAATALGKAAVKGVSRLADKAARQGNRLARVGARTSTERPWSGAGGLGREGGRIWQADPGLGQMTSKPVNAGAARWGMTDGTPPNGLNAPAQRPTSLDFASRRSQPYMEYETAPWASQGDASLPRPGKSVIEAVLGGPGRPGPRVQFSGVVQRGRYIPVEYSEDFIRQTQIKAPADPVEVAALMGSADPADDYIKVALLIRKP